MSTRATRTVEYYRLWEDHTWDTEFLEVPTDTPEEQLEDFVRAWAAKHDWQGELPVLVGLYHYADEEEDDADGPDE
jgi:hypothetical protein